MCEFKGVSLAQARLFPVLGKDTAGERTCTGTLFITFSTREPLLEKSIEKPDAAIIW